MALIGQVFGHTELNAPFATRNGNASIGKMRPYTELYTTINLIVVIILHWLCTASSDILKKEYYVSKHNIIQNTILYRQKMSNYILFSIEFLIVYTTLGNSGHKLYSHRCVETNYQSS